jgi:hypothetical protein
MEYEVLDEMAQPTDAAHGGGTEDQERLLRAQLAIEPDSESSCAVINAEKDIQEVTHHLKVSPSECCDGSDVTGCGECHTELTFDDEEQAYLRSAVGTKCICPIFEEHDCIPRIRAVDSGAIVVVLTVPTREILREIISDLRRVGASVSIEWLVNGSEHAKTTEIDVSTITEKQQEAMELAMEAGYYETPRQSDLGEIASELDISESAASQRLNAAETKLVKSFLDG